MKFDFAKYMAPEDVVRAAKRREEQAAIDARTVQVTAVRTNSFTSEERTVTVGVYPKGDYLYLVGGPTGAESMPIDKLEDVIRAGSWLACMGSPLRWDKLEVPGSELEKVRQSLSTWRKE